jgi:hypothetical protein
MRDNRFVAKHRGGPLNKVKHRQLIIWASACAEHVLSLLGEKTDDRLGYALFIAREWEKDKVAVGFAMKASQGAHTVARESSDPFKIAVARAVGHAVATAHMADHSLGSALYALKAVKIAGNSIDAERKWQYDHLPFQVKELIISSMIDKEKHFKI